MGLPLFALFPAIGPWYGSGILPNAFQSQCQNSLLALRSGGAPAVIGIVCFPSFHVIWAVLCVYAFWGFRWLRFPALILGSIIVVSTISTGWHYFVDVLAGLLLAGIWLRLARMVAFPSAALPEGDCAQVRNRESYRVRYMRVLMGATASGVFQ
jgi:membrane-associated phospholipid phosphatase